MFSIFDVGCEFDQNIEASGGAPGAAGTADESGRHRPAGDDLDVLPPLAAELARND
jgi:hypothetical protein